MNFNFKIEEFLFMFLGISIIVYLAFDFSKGSSLSLLTSEQTENSISNCESL